MIRRPRIWFPRHTFSCPRSQSIEMSNFLRRALDLRWSDVSSLCDGPTLSQPSCKPFQIKHRPQHCEILTAHTDSQLFAFVIKVEWRPLALQESHQSTQQTCDYRLPSTWRRYIAFVRRPTSCTSDLRNSGGDSSAMRLCAGFMKCARFT